MEEILTKQEITFCELFVNGTAGYAGNARKCYQQVFGDTSNLAKHHAKALLKRPDIQDYVRLLEEEATEEAKDIKRYLTENLKSIIDEMSTGTYEDRFGTNLSPAPMRSVAVQAAKALMDMYPVKEAQKVDLKASEAGGITFNVVVPDPTPKAPEES